MHDNVDNLITGEKIQPRFWTQLPNLIFEMGLSTNAIALYAAIKRSAGSSDGGQCTRSTRTLARNTGMSASSVVRAKRELASLGLIHIKEVATGRGYKAHHITARDIWPANNAFFDLEEKPTVSAGCKWGLDAGGNLVEFEVVKDDAGQIICKSSTVVLLVPEMEQSNNQRGKTYRKNQQHGGEKNDVGTGADVVADGLSSSQNLPQPADGPSESEADPGSGNSRVQANRDALAEYGVEWTRDAQAVAARSGMTPAFIHAWGTDVQARSDVANKPAYLLALLRTATDPPNERKEDNGRQRCAHRHGRHRESTWTGAELNESRMESLATCPLDVEYGCASRDGFLDLSDIEREQRAADMPRRVTQWAEKQTGEVAEAIRAVGGVYYGGDKFLSLNGQGEKSAPPLGQKDPTDS